MEKIISKLTISFFELIRTYQIKQHKKRMDKLNKEILSKTKDAKINISQNENVNFSTKQNELLLKRQTEIEKIVKNFLSEKDGIHQFFNYIKKHGTKVYKINNANKILSFIGEEEGFIVPQKGIKALYLNLILNKNIAFKTNEIFVLRDLYKNINIYALIYQFYNWYCFKEGLPVFNSKTQNNFKNITRICTTSEINNLTVKEIYSLKNAIHQDIEAIDFVINLCKQNKTSKECLNKIKDGIAIRV